MESLLSSIRSSDPDAVENIVGFDVSSDSLVLAWASPRNVPLLEDGSVHISYEISAGSMKWTAVEPRLRVSGLSPYTNYNFSVRAIVVYRTETHIGKLASMVVKTEPGKPSTVQNLRVEQRRYNPIVTVTYGPPKNPRGPVNYYVLEYGPLSSKAHLER